MKIATLLILVLALVFTFAGCEVVTVSGKRHVKPAYPLDQVDSEDHIF